MTAQTPDSKIVTEILPEKKQMPLEGPVSWPGIGRDVRAEGQDPSTHHVSDRPE